MAIAVLRIFKQRFGIRLPPITLHHQGYLRRGPIWLTKNLSLDRPQSGQSDEI